MSSQDFSQSNPEWQRLLEWIAEKDSARVTSEQLGEATPAPRLKNKSWLGPRKRPAIAFGLAGLIAIGAAGFSFLGAGQAEPELPQPDVVIDLFESRSDIIPAGFVQTMHDEMATDFSASSRITPEDGDGTRRLDAYQLQGSIDATDEDVRIFARIFAPGIDGPVLTTRMERPTEQMDALPLTVGSRLASLMRCVATASDSTGSDIVRLPEPAIKPWADFCRMTTVESADMGSRVATLRSVVEAAPDFANGWANLGENLVWASRGRGDEGRAMVAEAEAALDRAIELDDTTAKAYAVKALIALGITTGSFDTDSQATTLGNFDEWERLAQQSLDARPSDCGCEGPQYARAKQILGQPSQALPLYRQAVNQDRRNMGHLNEYIGNLILAGQLRTAEAQLDKVEDEWPNAGWTKTHRLNIAMVERDYTEALAIYRELAAENANPRAVSFLQALDSGDAARIEASSAYLTEAAKQRPTSTQYLSLLAADRPDAALDMIEAAYEMYGPIVLEWLWLPRSAPVYDEPEFASLAQRSGLLAYWKRDGGTPDFCKAAPAAKICRSL
ncbi:MAG: hypothetical protein HKO13_01710 [Sphingomonas sp.]|nr:hypothetical protein [Sphingomonas sp.]